MTTQDVPSEETVELFTNPNSRYFNRELSWIEFNRRVIEEAFDVRNPLLERIKFLSIWASNLDEFFMIRVSGIKQQISAGVQKLSRDGATPTEQLHHIRQALLPLLVQERDLLLNDLLPSLREQHIHLYNYDNLNRQQKDWLRTYYQQQIFPVLTPLAFDSSRPFPFISNLSLNLAVVIRDRDKGELFARVKVPEVLPRLIALPQELCEVVHDQPAGRQACFVWIEQAIAAHLDLLFPGVEIVEHYPFRVVRNADMEIEEDEANDLLETIEQGVRQRRFGEVVRLTIDSSMPERIATILSTNLKIESNDIYTVRGPLGLADLFNLYRLDRPDLKDPPYVPVVPLVLQNNSDIFETIRGGDILLHHPYHSFSPVIDFIHAAAEDPHVLAIKQTLYRVGSNSPIVRALMHARELGKQVTAVVELKARFDEENNIVWARALERAGVHVVYGLVGLKVHAKLALVVRQEADRLRCYAHLGTGNYNATTARIYTDLGLFTCREDITADVVELFNSLTAYGRRDQYRKLLVAPVTMRHRLLAMIEREMQRQATTGNGRIIIKVNALVDRQMIDALYRASKAGVQIDLIVRGMCALRPGLPGVSENIRVRSIIGPFLEHHRIYYFGNGGEPEIYLGSADLMERNLDRRVEELFPVEDPALARYVRKTMLDTYLNDNTRAHVLHANGTYERRTPGEDEPVDSQVPAWMLGE
ncbi:polyphosphate kinase 1 [Candidatus Chloroploca sp. M-50]|uniref:Polyphosphate kinase n=1 Tax=Candidatus Chloroploca mongolica TaxID=2528176 RepID=A0ABS4D9A6_9CHLR|nr:polyphosphate kinase 1 [Candidatus Chloroploca mongolica]MBP1466012.1 polyphosphate kinase 1 [Candidatus Chloroploca mongolica]